MVVRHASTIALVMALVLGGVQSADAASGPDKALAAQLAQMNATLAAMAATPSNGSLADLRRSMELQQMHIMELQAQLASGAARPQAGAVPVEPTPPAPQAYQHPTYPPATYQPATYQQAAPEARPVVVQAALQMQPPPAPSPPARYARPAPEPVAAEDMENHPLVRELRARIAELERRAAAPEENPVVQKLMARIEQLEKQTAVPVAAPLPLLAPAGDGGARQREAANQEHVVLASVVTPAAPAAATTGVAVATPGTPVWLMAPAQTDSTRRGHVTRKPRLEGIVLDGAGPGGVWLRGLQHPYERPVHVLVGQSYPALGRVVAVHRQGARWVLETTVGWLEAEGES